MNSNHDIKDLDLLYEDAKKLVNVIVTDQIDGVILKDINGIIVNMGENWHGQDAATQINKLIDVNNMIIDNRDILGNIGSYISMLAKNYRDAQNSNSTLLPSFTQLEYKKIMKSKPVIDNSSEVYMSNELSNNITILNNIVNSIEDINNSVIVTKDSIFNNWIQEDENRNYALKMLEQFSENSKTITKNINDVIKNINNSIDNYNLSKNKVSSMPSLASMFASEETTKEYSPEEVKVLDSIEKNFDSNKKVTNDFNNALVEEMKKDLKSKGILE